MLSMLWPVFWATILHFNEVLFLEEQPVVGGLSRARRLSDGRFARGLGLLGISALLRLAISAAAMTTSIFVLGFVLALESPAQWLDGWPALCGYVAVGPYVAYARLFDYIDARTRLEGWDIQVRFAAIARRFKPAVEIRELQQES